ncbi:hypothetical protein BC938DRAFT_472392 [Jimgerdemannia flammicorona]|uniref:Uncharacterized protein n=1 Tax=Jimgerdemannia flammicorona TaxID=994334 RepID=A0A433Q673_9FUNG|nr:hypothetical protein BC938DRAFT_472392 [Jimgerdemannia flammicorona]
MAIERQLARQRKVLEVIPMSHSLKILTEAYRKMQDNRKWRLFSGKVVEDALFSFAVKCPNEQFFRIASQR